MSNAVALKNAGGHAPAGGEFVITSGHGRRGDPRLLRVVLNNLLGNRLEVHLPEDTPAIEFGRFKTTAPTPLRPRQTGWLRNDLPGETLRGVQRLHAMTISPATGWGGLETVQEHHSRHGGAASEAEGETRRRTRPSTLRCDRPVPN